MADELGPVHDSQPLTENPLNLVSMVYTDTAPQLALMPLPEIKNLPFSQTNVDIPGSGPDMYPLHTSIFTVPGGENLPTVYFSPGGTKPHIVKDTFDNVPERSAMYIKTALNQGFNVVTWDYDFNAHLPNEAIDPNAQDTAKAKLNEWPIAQQVREMARVVDYMVQTPSADAAQDPRSHLNKDHAVIMGRSAGARAAFGYANEAYQDEKVQDAPHYKRPAIDGFIAIAPAIRINEDSTHKEPIKESFKKKFMSREARFSPEVIDVVSKDVPLVLIHGSADPAVKKEEASEPLFRYAQATNKKAIYAEIKNGDHDLETPQAQEAVRAVVTPALESIKKTFTTAPAHH